MPAWLPYVMTIGPLNHFPDIAYGVVLEGAMTRTQSHRMALPGVAVFGFAPSRFRRSLQ